MDKERIKVLELNYLNLKKKIISNVNGKTSPPLLIAVSKTKPVDDIQCLYDLGHRDFGENYAQELCEKAEHFISKGITDISWHFIGAIQSNKIKLIFKYINFLHSLSSDSHLTEISKQYKIFSTRGRLKVLVQVNIDSQDSKSGCRVSELREFLGKVKQNSDVEFKGLMCIPNASKNYNGESFLKMKLLSVDLFGAGNQIELSMGMSDDYSMAIANGATMIRVGSQLFGERV